VLAADPKVVQRVLGHAAAAMTMDLYGTWWMTTCGRLPRWSGGCTASKPIAWRLTWGS
jgi:hypothetical protein